MVLWFPRQKAVLTGLMTTRYSWERSGRGHLTDSGYPRIVKKWQRGTPLKEAQTLHSGEKSDVGVWPFVIHGQNTTLPMIARAMTFYTSKYFVIREDQSLLQILSRICRT